MSNILKTPTFRASYPAIFRPNKEDFGGGFSVVAIFPKGTDISEIKKLANATAKEKWPNKIPKFKHIVFHKCEEKEDDDGNLPDGYEAGGTYITLKSKRQVPVVDSARQPIDDEHGFKAGDWARAGIVCYAYDNNFGKGIGFGLRALQKVRDGEPLGSSIKAEDFFEAVEGEDVESDASSDDAFS